MVHEAAPGVALCLAGSALVAWRWGGARRSACARRASRASIAGAVPWLAPDMAGQVDPLGQPLLQAAAGSKAGCTRRHTAGMGQRGGAALAGLLRPVQAGFTRVALSSSSRGPDHGHDHGDDYDQYDEEDYDYDDDEEEEGDEMFRALKIGEYVVLAFDPIAFAEPAERINADIGSWRLTMVAIGAALLQSVAANASPTASPEPV